MEYLYSLLLPSLILIPLHVHRDANKVATKLVNARVDMQDHDLDYAMRTEHEYPLLQECMQISTQEGLPLSGVPTHKGAICPATWRCGKDGRCVSFNMRLYLYLTMLINKIACTLCV